MTTQPKDPPKAVLAILVMLLSFICYMLYLSIGPECRSKQASWVRISSQVVAGGEQRLHWQQNVFQSPNSTEASNLSTGTSKAQVLLSVCEEVFDIKAIEQQCLQGITLSNFSCPHHAINHWKC